MNKKIVVLIIFATVLSLPFVAHAMVSDLSQLIDAIARAAGMIFGGIAVVCFLAAGVMFLTSGGQPDRLQVARSAVMWGIVGIIIGILAFSIIGIVSNILQ